MATDAPLPRPLDRVGSIRTKLGILVAVTVAVSAATPTLAAWVGVPARVSIPVAVLVALAVTQLLARGMTSPLREMTAAARRMARGEYDRRVTATSRDEVGELARAFNTMAADLGAVDSRRRELIATVSHELRTPISALQAVLENLADGVCEPDPATLRSALAQADRLGRLVADLLDLSRVDAGVTPLHPAPFEVGPFVTSVVEEARLTARPTCYNAVCEPGLVLVADRARLHQLLANLLDNAARHNPPGGTVNVRAAREGDGVVLEVSDQGEGIPAEERSAVFERFTTGRHATESTGLGLAVARWVTDLHGGTIEVAEPPDGLGCLVRTRLPSTPVPPPVPLPAPLPAPTFSAPSYSAPTTEPLLEGVFGGWWPEPDVPARPRIVLAAVGVGGLAATLLPDRSLGIGAYLVLAAAAVTVAAADRRLRSPVHLAGLALCLALGAVTFLRDAEWVMALSLLGAATVATATLAAGRSFTSLLLAGVAVPLAALRGLPWLTRSATVAGRAGRSLRAARTAVLSLLAAAAFGALFASADAVFAGWVDVVVPDLSVDQVVGRSALLVLASAAVLTMAYLALNPPRRDVVVRLRPGVTAEWLVPVLVTDAVFALFVAAQGTVLFGGHDYVQRAGGVTYATYAREGFAQLTVATALTLLVVALAAARADREDARQRLLLRVALGTLCVLALVVTASALWRLHLYEEAYGFTRLRLLGGFVEGWLGLVLVLVMVTGVRLRAGWLAPTVVATGAGALLLLASLNPDGYVASRNVERYLETGKVDTGYLADLSADAAPALTRLPTAVAACVLPDASPSQDDDWLEWNLGRSRAAGLVEDPDECRRPARP